MTAGELLEILEDLDPDTEVLLAMQPNYPMEYSIRSTYAEGEDGDGNPILWLAEGRQTDYLCGDARDQLGW